MNDCFVSIVVANIGGVGSRGGSDGLGGPGDPGSPGGSFGSGGFPVGTGNTAGPNTGAKVPSDAVCGLGAILDVAEAGVSGTGAKDVVAVAEVALVARVLIFGDVLKNVEGAQRYL